VPVGSFQKVGECLYRYSSNGVYYARIKSSGKEIRRSLENTEAQGVIAQHRASGDPRNHLVSEPAMQPSWFLLANAR
jgi:hypothetical protein